MGENSISVDYQSQVKINCVANRRIFHAMRERRGHTKYQQYSTYFNKLKWPEKSTYTTGCITHKDYWKSLAGRKAELI